MKANFQNQLRKSSRSSRGARMLVVALFCSTLLGHCSTSTVHASPTQDDVFKSIQNNVNESVDGGKVLAVLAAVAGLGIMLMVFSRRQKREAAPRALNHQGRLMREMMKTAGLKSSEARQLKALADEIAAAGEPLESPLTLMLCPSLLKQSTRSKR